VSRLPPADTTDATDEPPVVVTDEARESLLAGITDELGDAVVGFHIRPGDDLWIRVDRDAWLDIARFLHTGLGFAYFNFLSAIDWMPSPYGRSMDSGVDLTLEGVRVPEPGPVEQGLAGGDTRFQVLARVDDVISNMGITLKVDIPEDDLSLATWVPVYPGANWHERECWEMFGIEFSGHPGLRHLYLPGEFEGNPMRKDYPLLARQVRPWPGIVDVEAMPDDDKADS